MHTILTTKQPTDHASSWMHWLCVSVIALSTLTVWWWEAQRVQADSLVITRTPAPLHGTMIQKNPPVTTLVAVGDIMLSRDVEQKMIQKHDWTYPFLETATITSAGDIAFGNLETPLITGPAVPTNSMSFRTDPQAVNGLTYAGFDVLSLANNHMKNHGTEGISSTLATLDQAGIAHAGAGITPDEARQPVIVEKNGVTFGFLAYTYSADSSTTATTNHMDEQRLITDIETLKSTADAIVVSMHAGNEYQNRPNQQQISFAHTAIDHGASIVIGHHPHVVQSVEHYGDGYILYSLGNFVFDQMWSRETREGAIAAITFTGAKPSAPVLTPVLIYDFSQPRVVTGTEGDAILNRMNGFTN